MTTQKFDTISVCAWNTKELTPPAIQISIKMLNTDAVGGDDEECYLPGYDNM